MLTTSCQRFAIGARVVCVARYFAAFHGQVGVVSSARLSKPADKPELWVYGVDFPARQLGPFYTQSSVEGFPFAEPELDAAPENEARSC